MGRKPPISPSITFSSSQQNHQQTKQIDELNRKIADLEQELAQRNQKLLEQVPSDKISQKTVPIKQLRRRSFRSRTERDPQKFNALIDSIKSYGFRGTIWVQRKPDGSLWIVGGETRTDAAEAAGLTEIPADIVDVDDLTAAKLCRAENNRRQNLNELDDTNEVIYLLSLMLGLTRDEVIAALHKYRNAADGKSSIDPDLKQAIEQGFQELEPTISLVTFIAQRLRLLNLPADVLEAYQKGLIGQIKALELTKVADDTKRQELLEQVIEQNLSISQIRELIKAMTPAKSQSFAQIQGKLIKTRKQFENVIPADTTFINGLTADEREHLKVSISELEQLIRERKQLLENH